MTTMPTHDELTQWLAEDRARTEHLLAEILERDREQLAELEQWLAGEQERTAHLLAEIEAANRATLEELLR